MMTKTIRALRRLAMVKLSLVWDSVIRLCSISGTPVFDGVEPFIFLLLQAA